MSGLSVSRVCSLAGKSRQAYYRSLWSRKRSRERADEVVSLVERIRAEMPRVGVRKIYHMARERLRPLRVGRDRLFSILRANYLLVRPARAYHVTTRSRHRFRKYENLTEGLRVCRPEQVWASDITYVGNGGRHLYLALVTDVYSKRVMGHDLSESLAAEGCLRALDRANRERMYGDELLIHHSDRGIQYCCGAYQERLRRYGMRVSMTEGHDPYANAVAERVNGILKQEFLLEEYDLPLREMRRVVRDAIGTYNRDRPHYSCGYLTPDQMHRQREVEIKTYKKSGRKDLDLDKNKVVL